MILQYRGYNGIVNNILITMGILHQVSRAGENCSWSYIRFENVYANWKEIFSLNFSKQISFDWSLIPHDPNHNSTNKNLTKFDCFEHDSVSTQWKDANNGGRELKNLKRDAKTVFASSEEKSQKLPFQGKMSPSQSPQKIVVIAMISHHKDCKRIENLNEAIERSSQSS